MKHTISLTRSQALAGKVEESMVHTDCACSRKFSVPQHVMMYHPSQLAS